MKKTLLACGVVGLVSWAHGAYCGYKYGVEVAKTNVTKETSEDDPEINKTMEEFQKELDDLLKGL